tara:strand:- start:58 stop:660 length:603 start_codon:yes stop_codon:yes gene_type:complete
MTTVNKRFVTPAGTALYPRLNEPDFKFNEAGEYKTGLVIPAADAQEFIGILEGLYDDAQETIKAEQPGKKIKKADPPWTIQDDGSLMVRFKMRAKIKTRDGREMTLTPIIVDAKGTPCNVNVGGGSRIKVAFTTAPYHTALVGAGLSMRLQGVQVLTLSQGGGMDLGFGVEEGFTAQPEVAQKSAPAKAPARDEEEDADF